MYKCSFDKIKIYIKYYYHFHKLLFTLFTSQLYINIFNKPNSTLNTILYRDIQNNGCVIIKLIQWLYTRNKNFNNKYTSLNNSQSNFDDIFNNNFNNIFNNIYENCKLHKLEYSKQLFQKEFSANFDDIIELDPEYKIKSGSIAQVYKARLKNTQQEVAIKITHPELYEQLLFPYIYYKIYDKITTNIAFFKNYRIPFELSDFFDSFLNQTDMRIEATNLKYFYKEYRSNPYILIPKPIVWSNNILIMQYIEARNFNDIKNEISDYTKYKIILLLNLFIKDSMCLLDYYHADLHDSNWKVVIKQPTTNIPISTSINPSIVIYDFGFCIKKSENDKRLMQNLHKTIETNNITEFAGNLYQFIYYNPTNISKEKFIEVIINITKLPLITTNSLYSNQLLTLIISYFITKKYIFKSQILDMFITLLLVNDNLKKYLYAYNIDEPLTQPMLNKNTNDKNTDDKNTNNKNTDDKNTYDKNNNEKLCNLKSQMMNYINFCKTNKCFYRLQNYLIDYIKEIDEKIYTGINKEIEKHLNDTISSNNIINIEL